MERDSRLPSRPQFIRRHNRLTRPCGQRVRLPPSGSRAAGFQCGLSCSVRVGPGYRELRTALRAAAARSPETEHHCGARA
jgi:hypothetical protein